jgi:hypothetical protein
MVVLLQGYVGASDAEAVELSLVDLRWQMVLDCLGTDTPPFSQGALQTFRERMVAHETDRVLLDRTVALVRSGVLSGSDGRAVSKALRVAMDSRPLVGAGRVEDTLNLLSHAARSIVRLVSKLTEREPEEICRKAGISLLLASSIKAGLDIDWSDPKQKAMAVDVVERQVSSLQRWVDRHLHEAVSEPLRPYIDALTQVQAQDLETSDDGRKSIRQGVAPDHRISVEDPEMRHGRTSRSKRFDGYKEHVARDLDFPAIVACAVTPANRPEEEAALPMGNDIERQKLRLVEFHIARAYVNSPVVDDVIAAGGSICAPARSLAPRARRNPSNQVRPCNSIRRRARHASSVQNAHRLRPEEASPSPSMSHVRETSDNYNRASRGERHCVNALRSNTPSRILPPARVTTLVTAVCAKISSTCDVQQRFKTSKACIA